MRHSCSFALAIWMTLVACGDDASDAGGSGGGGAAQGGAHSNGGAAMGGAADGGAAAGGGGSSTTGNNRVFVTSAKYDGALGGLVGGDAQCQALADEEGL